MVAELVVEPLTAARGRIAVPGSKSLSNRALLLAAMAAGETIISGLLVSDDTHRMLDALRQLGCDVGLRPDGTCQVVGNRAALTGNRSDQRLALDLGNAGTAMRPLVAVLSLLSDREVLLTGDKRMQERPIGALVAALHQVGAQISFASRDGYPPLLIQPRPTGACPSVIAVDGSLSSQYVTALLMALPLLGTTVELNLMGQVVSLPYIDLTCTVLKAFGVTVERLADNRYLIPAASRYVAPGQYVVEADASSASYFWAAGAIGGGPVRVLGVDAQSCQGDVAFCEALARMGAQVTYGDGFIEVASAGGLVGIDIDANHIPDAAMTLAMVALFARGPTVIRNIYNWRIKETDRLAAMACELAKLGAEVVEHRDHLVVAPPQRFRPARIATYDDHRMAMCFALAAFGGVPVTILDPGCTSKTYPGFFADFAAVTAGSARG